MNKENQESLYSLAVRSIRPDVQLFDDEHLSTSERNLHFAMRCNGYFMLINGQWIFDPNVVKPFSEEFKGQQVSFFGPNSSGKFFSSFEQVSYERFIRAFDQQLLTSAIAKYRDVDEDLAARIAFIFGGIVRYLTPQTDELVNAVGFAARMSLLGEGRSGAAIVSAIAMYIISGGSLEQDNHFVGQVYHMAEAIGKDPVNPLETEDLGLSQVVRLKTFVEGISTEEGKPLTDIVQYKGAFDRFPTVGAEFHFDLDVSKKHPDFWQRLAILNMSQYQRGSYVQLSRNDRDVIEVRMNPAIYPITIANWNHMKLLLPDLNQAFFTITLNRKIASGNFIWTNNKDEVLLNNLLAIGMLTYAGVFDDVPHATKAEEIDFGAIYLGQTVKINNGEYVFSGNWEGVKEKQYGQLGIYAGFGDILPHLAYYLSMVLTNPDILQSVDRGILSRIGTLDDALTLKPTHRQSIFRAIQRSIEGDGNLRRAFESGDKILELLSS